MTRYPRTSLATCCIPWNENFDFDEVVFRASIANLVGSGLRDLYLFGTAGEGYAITETQFDRIVRVFADEMAACGATPMVGVLSLSLLAMIGRIERAMEMGVRDFQISLPSWGALNDTELKVFFDETCGRFPQCRFLHYNLLRAKRLMTAQEYSRLGDKHPNLVATKNSTNDMDRIRSLLEDAPQLRHFFTETGYAFGSQIGEPGFLVSIASSHPARALEYFRAGAERDANTLLKMQGELSAMVGGLFEDVGGAAHMDGAFDKIFCKLLNPDFPLRLLPPYQSASLAAFERYRDFLRRDFPQWLPLEA